MECLSNEGVDRVLNDGPWSFQNDFIIFEKSSQGKRVADYVFDEISIWIQLHNLPIDLLTI